MDWRYGSSSRAPVLRLNPSPTKKKNFMLSSEVWILLWKDLKSMMDSKQGENYQIWVLSLKLSLAFLNKMHIRLPVILWKYSQEHLCFQDTTFMLLGRDFV
jgi:hypothetical protein